MNFFNAYDCDRVRLVNSDLVGYRHSVSKILQTNISPAERAERLVLRHHRPDDEFVALLQLTFNHVGHLCKSMISNPERNFDRLHRVVGVTFPDNGSIALRAAGLALRFPGG